MERRRSPGSDHGCQCRCLGHPRGGLGTKFHALTNQDSPPIRYELTPGQAHDAPSCKRFLEGLQLVQYVLANTADDANISREPNKFERFLANSKPPSAALCMRYRQQNTSLIALKGETYVRCVHNHVAGKKNRIF